LKAKRSGNEAIEAKRNYLEPDGERKEKQSDRRRNA
jgi:hypothetical protein